MKVSTCFAKNLELNDTGNLFFKNCLIKYGSFIDSLVPIGFYHISESRKHRSNSFTPICHTSKILLSFQSPPTNQWSGFYMIGTSIMKELRNHKVIRKNSGTRFPIYSHKERGNQFFSTVWGQLFSTYANFSKELTFLTP